MSNIVRPAKDRIVDALKKISGNSSNNSIERNPLDKIADEIELIAEKGISGGGGGSEESGSEESATETREVLLPETVFTVTSENEGGIDFDNQLEEFELNTTYIVTLNGVEYSCTGNFNGSTVILCDSNSLNYYNYFYISYSGIYLENYDGEGYIPAPNGDYTIKIEKILYDKERTTILPETTLIVNEIYDGTAQENYTGPRLEANREYIVTYDGVEYICKAYYQSNDELIVVALTDTGTENYNIFEVTSGDDNWIKYEVNTPGTHTIKIEYEVRAVVGNHVTILSEKVNNDIIVPESYTAVRQYMLSGKSVDLIYKNNNDVHKISLYLVIENDSAIYGMEFSDVGNIIKVTFRPMFETSTRLIGTY